MTSLRERQRLQTSHAIRQAAVDMVYAHGLDKVTTEMISEAAGISPRTFFNYFPYKEAALILPKEDFSDAEITKFLAGHGSLLDDLADLIVPVTEMWAANRPMLKKLFEMADSHPKLIMLKANSVHEHEMGLRTIIALRLGQKESDYTPILMAAVLTSAIRVAMENWACGGTDTADLSAEASIRHAFDALRSTFTL